MEIYVPISCPGCGHASKVKSKRIGHAVRCPKCRRQFVIDATYGSSTSSGTIAALSEIAAGKPLWMKILVALASVALVACGIWFALWMSSADDAFSRIPKGADRVSHFDVEALGKLGGGLLSGGTSKLVTFDETLPLGGISSATISESRSGQTTRLFEGVRDFSKDEFESVLAKVRENARQRNLVEQTVSERDTTGAHFSSKVGAFHYENWILIVESDVSHGGDFATNCVDLVRGEGADRSVADDERFQQLREHINEGALAFSLTMSPIDFDELSVENDTLQFNSYYVDLANVKGSSYVASETFFFPSESSAKKCLEALSIAQHSSGIEGRAILLSQTDALKASFAESERKSSVDGANCTVTYNLTIN
ncbi:MAG: zinc-ribbon domain-containing protein [Planctomycetes bacterium]|nr:zinc-ribbon domain-containing protein [Planctomycetota bacterium]